LLVREPENQYDANAIRVENVRSERIGHIAREIAARLAPFMDSRALLVEATCSGPKSHYDCPITLELYGSNDPTQRDLLKEKMRIAKLPTNELQRREKDEMIRRKEREARQKALAKAAKKGGMSIPNGIGGSFVPGMGDYVGGSSQGITETMSLEQIMRGSERFNPRNIEKAVEQFGLKEKDLANMEYAEQPDALQTKMLPYQLQVRVFPAGERKILTAVRA
jgi:SWI/SNF-related matrix-associated actin-dependent regulator of chromatin subfamily A3